MANYTGIEEIVYALRAEITYGKTTVKIIADDVQQYSPNSTLSSQCLPIGATAAMTFSLTFNNEDYGLTAANLDGAQVRVFATVGTETEKPFGVWYVDASDVSEQNPFVTISGSDALETKFEATWTDADENYPRSFLLMARTAAAAAGLQLANDDFHNANYSRSKKPDWGEDCTLRDVIAYIAACAAGFARVNYAGELEICTISNAGKHTADADYYSELSLSGSFKFNCFEYKFDSDDEEEYTRYAIDSSIADNATNTIQMSGNPLMTDYLANSIAQKLKNVSYEGASLTWFGGVEVLPGDDLTITDTKGVTHKLILTSHSMNIDGGVSASSMSDMPSSLTQSGGYSTGVSVFNSDGTINVEAVVGVEKTVISANIAYFDELTAETIKTSKLTASIINAVKLWADSIESGDIKTDNLTAAVATVIEGYFNSLTVDDVHASELVAAFLQAANIWAQAIDAGSVNTDYLTAAVANVIQATINKINAGTVSTDELYAAIAEIVALKVSSLKAEDVTADRLGAALAAFGVITAGTANFDRATVQHLVAEALNLTFGTAGEVFVENLRVAYAQVLSATIGNLCIKASDGNYYTIDVDENGNITAVLTTVSEGEINAGQTEGGKAILETSITAESLNTSNLLATYALVNKIDAARIDVDQLFANEAFINALATSTIYNDTSLQMIIGSENEMSKWFTFDNESGFTIRKPAYTDGEGIEHPESIWRFVAVETGIRIYRSDLIEPVLSAERDCVAAPKLLVGKMLVRSTPQGTIVFQHQD